MEGAIRGESPGEECGRDPSYRWGFHPESHDGAALARETWPQAASYGGQGFGAGSGTNKSGRGNETRRAPESPPGREEARVTPGIASAGTKNGFSA